ncbi:MAG: CRISPR-associated protein Csx19 [Blastocatellia bacterium]
MTQLYCRTQTNIALADALTNCRDILQSAEGSQTVALLYAPDRCRFATFADGQLRDEKGVALNAQTVRNVFEARVFNPVAELRWLHTAHGAGDAALLAEQDIASYLAHTPVAACEFDRLDELEPLEQIYLLWGESTGSAPAPGWQRLTAARIGRLDVPLPQPLAPRQRVQLLAREYLREVDKYGNVAVVEERLLKLEVASDN